MIRRVGLAATSSLAAGVLALIAAAPAIAAPADTPVSGDQRATAYNQHVYGNPTKCSDVVGLDKSLAGSTDLDVTGEIKGVYLTITSVPDGYELTGVVVKGSDAFNLYLGDVRTNLHAPMTGKDNKEIAGISHWFACGKKKTTTSSSKPPSSSSKPPSSSSSSSSSSNSSSTAPAGQGSNGGSGTSGTDLASTGVSTTGPLVGGSALVLIGGGLLYWLRRTRRQN